ITVAGRGDAGNLLRLARVGEDMPTPARRNRAARGAARRRSSRVTAVAPPSLRVGALPSASLPCLKVVEATLKEWLGDPTPKPPTAPARARPPVIPATILWCGLLVCVLHGFHAQLDLWRLLTKWGLWHFPRVEVSDMAIYARLERTPPKAMHDLFFQVTQAIRTRLPERSVV